MVCTYDNYKNAMRALSLEECLRIHQEIASEVSGDPDAEELYDELVEAGKKGLVIAIPKYDRSHGFRFISYAVWFVRNSILQAIEDKFKS